MIRMLQDITGIDPTKVPLDDKETMSIFSSTKALGVTPEQIHSEVGSFGVPEFGTKFVRGMLVDTRPTTFDELIRISGLSHGTDVWLGNAQSLIEAGTVTLQDAICCRDDIMIYLIKQGLPPNPAFKIMETVRKGKALKDPEKWAEYVSLMKEHNVPDWYIKSCEKIKYMFPKAHAAAYVTNAFRIAWFKVHQPLAYYASYFSIRADEFDSECMIYGKEKVKNKMKEIDLAGNNATVKDKNMYAILELVLEMYERGFNFLPMDLYKSDATKFLVQEEGIRPPLNSIPGLGTVAAQGIENAKKDGKFMSIDDLKIRSKVGTSVTDLLKKFGCLERYESKQSNEFICISTKKKEGKRMPIQQTTIHLEELFSTKNIIIYLFIINLLGFFIMWIDKRKAKKGSWRIPEKTLFIITALGGGIGTIAGMYTFRHKTQKLNFVIGFPFITTLEVIGILWYFLGKR